MTHKALPVLPVSDLRTQAKEILESVRTQPIVITQRGRANAVLVSYELYNDMTARLERLEDFRDEVLLRRAQEMSEGTAPAEALKAQYGKLFDEPFEAGEPVVARVTQSLSMVKEAGAKYQTARRKKKTMRNTLTKRRANV